MNKEETLALFAQGKDAWNQWANAMLDEKKRLQENGEWEEKGKEWEEREKADFESYNFYAVNFGGFIFPGRVFFVDATFSGEAHFSNATFYGYAGFVGATFSSEASFVRAEFFGDACFTSATFSDYAGFHGVTFSRNAGFTEVKFLDKANFEVKEFGGEADFSHAEFHKRAEFIGAVFKKKSDFSSVDFLRNAAFSQCRFEQEAKFKAIDAERGFDLDSATFARVPDFIQAHFLEAPRLDNVDIPEPITKEWSFDDFLKLLQKQLSFPRTRESSAEESPSPRPSPLKGEGETARYRALKRMAIQAHDHKCEQDFFAGELKSMRGTEHQPPFGKNWGWFLMGHAYESLSNFGRSPFRVIEWMFIQFMIFTYAYYLMARNLWGCAASTISPVWAAVQLSLGKMLFPFGNAMDSTSHMSACLYGVGPEFGVGRSVPMIPHWFPLISLTQSLFSLILIFLLLLTIRAHFRVK